MPPTITISGRASDRFVAPLTRLETQNGGLGPPLLFQSHESNQVALNSTNESTNASAFTARIGSPWL